MELSINNRVTLDQMRGMTEREVADLAVDQLALLAEAVDERKADARTLDDKLRAAMHARYAERAGAARGACGKSHGTITIQDGMFSVRADLPQKVEWDQSALHEACAALDSRGKNPGEYVRYKIEVAEAKFKAWPSSIRALFEPARTTSHGKPSYQIVGENE